MCVCPLSDEVLWHHMAGKRRYPQQWTGLWARCTLCTQRKFIFLFHRWWLKPHFHHLLGTEPLKPKNWNAGQEHNHMCHHMAEHCSVSSEQRRCHQWQEIWLCFMPSPSETQFPPLALDSASENEIGKRGPATSCQSQTLSSSSKIGKDCRQSVKRSFSILTSNDSRQCHVTVSV